MASGVVHSEVLYSNPSLNPSLNPNPSPNPSPNPNPNSSSFYLKFLLFEAAGSARGMSRDGLMEIVFELFKDGLAVTGLSGPQRIRISNLLL